VTNNLVVLTGNPAIVTNLQGTFRGNPIIMDRVADTISTPNMQGMTIYPAKSNSPSIFESPAPNLSKSNAPAK
jgi:hypothetical protein